MNSTMISTLPISRRLLAPATTSLEAFRQPAYECEERADTIILTVYIPGVDASGVEIEGRSADLTVTATKPHSPRVNFNALQLERVQRDYRLRLRLGTGFDYPKMAAELTRGVLTVTIPKRNPAAHLARLSKAA